VTTGVVTAALIIAGAMVIGAGYLGLGVVMLALGGAAGLLLMITSLRHDVPNSRPRRDVRFRGRRR
jgi:hypothetical protein